MPLLYLRDCSLGGVSPLSYAEPASRRPIVTMLSDGDWDRASNANISEKAVFDALQSAVNRDTCPNIFNVALREGAPADSTLPKEQVITGVLYRIMTQLKPAHPGAVLLGFSDKARFQPGRLPSLLLQNIRSYAASDGIDNAEQSRLLGEQLRQAGEHPDVDKAVHEEFTKMHLDHGGDLNRIQSSLKTPLRLPTPCLSSGNSFNDFIFPTSDIACASAPTAAD